VTDETAPVEELGNTLAEADDADDGLRAVVEALVTQGRCAWAGILFTEAGELVLGPQAGTPQPDNREHVPVDYQGSRVAELVADGCGDVAYLERVAALISPYCLVGWDTGGVPWDPAA
jgi:hypothetical protein